jgi:cytochrome c-type biogenesis protein CcmH
VKLEAAPGRGVLPGNWRLAVVAAIVLLLVVAAVSRQALSTAAPAATPEARAHAIGERLACPICEGLSVADSPSALAQQMRAEITDQIAAGQSDAQIQQYFVARYGPAILLTPPKQGFTLLAWWAPILFIVCSAVGIGLAAYRWSRRPGTEEALPALTAEEERQYAARLAAQLPGGAAAQGMNPPAEPTKPLRGSSGVLPMPESDSPGGASSVQPDRADAMARLRRSAAAVSGVPAAPGSPAVSGIAESAQRAPGERARP